MYVDKGLRNRRWIRPAAITLLLLAAVLIPAWLWLERGRLLPITVVLRAERYIASPGDTLAVAADIRPTDRDTALAWTGPGVLGSGSEASWTLPTAPGIYTASLKVRRSGAVAKDQISVRVLPHNHLHYSLYRPTLGPAPPSPQLPDCRGAMPAVSWRIHGRPCRGANVVVELRGAPNRQVWLSRAKSAHQARLGRATNIRVPAAQRSGPPRSSAAPKPAGPRHLEISGVLVDKRRQCVDRVTRNIALANCDAGPRPGHLFADFGWQLLGPRVFRLAAKPPRKPSTDTPRYYWDFGDGKQATGKTPAIVHDYAGHPRRQHIVRLGVEVGTERRETVRVITDRTFPE